MFIADSFFLEKNSRQLDNLRREFSVQKTDFIWPDSISKFEISAVHFVDIIFIEDYEKMRKGLHKIYKSNQGTFIDTDPRLIDDFFSDVSNNIHLDHWTRVISIGKIDKEIDQYFEYISVSLSAKNNSYIELFVNVKTSEMFNDKVSGLINSAEDKRFIRFVPPRYKTDFFNLKKWSKVTYDKYNHKESVIEDEILELKWVIGKHLNKHIPLFFYENKLKAPSLEFYNITKTACPLKGPSLSDYSTLGFDSGVYYTDTNSDGNIEVAFKNYTERSMDSSIKIFLNDLNYKREFFSFREYSSAMAMDIDSRLLSLLAYNNMKNFYEKTFLDINKDNYKKMSYRFPVIFKLKMFVSLKLNLDKKLMMFNRVFNSELEEKMLRKEREYVSLLGITNREGGNLAEIINWNTTHKVRSIRQLTNQIKSSLDEYVVLLNTIIDYRRQGRMIFISLVTLSVSIIALYISLKIK